MPPRNSMGFLEGEVLRFLRLIVNANDNNLNRYEECFINVSCERVKEKQSLESVRLRYDTKSKKKTVDR